jgi:CRP-like cAMP-binding protein
MLTAGHTRLQHTLQALAAIPDAELAAVLRLFQPIHIAKDGFFVRAGERPSTIGFLVAGLLRLYYLDEDGNEWTKSFCVEGEFIGAYRALLENAPSQLFIQALEPTTLLVASYAAYQERSDQHICWQIVNRKLIERLFVKKEQRESAFLLDDATTRYQTFLAEYPSLEQRVKQHQIASYLGITPVSLSRLRAQLKRS